MASIQKPVGLKCNGIGNLPGDVAVIQVLLNNFLLLGCLGPAIIPLVVDGQCGNKTCEALYFFQRGIMGWKKSDMRVDPGGATLARLHGPLKWVNRIPGDPVVIDDWKPKAPDDDYELTGVGFEFGGSQGIDIGGKYGVTAGTLKATDMANLKSYSLNYAAVGRGLGTPVTFDFSTYSMTSVGLVYPIDRTHEEMTVDDITGWCLIYQAQGGAKFGGYVTLMLLSVGAGLVGGMLAGLTGVGALLAPAIVLKSCHAAVVLAGWNATIPSAGVSGAVGYLGFGDVKGKLAVFE